MTFVEKYGPWAVVAGSSEGLGAALAHGAASRGCDVVLIARTLDELAPVAAEIERMHHVCTRSLAIELGDSDAAAQVLAGVADLEVGFFVYNAANEPRGMFVDTPDEDLGANVHVNCTVPSLIIKALAKQMVERGRGGIGLCSSGGALQGIRIFAAYGAAKAYQLMLAEGLWDELREQGVDVMGYVIGAVLTPSFKRNVTVTPELESAMLAAGVQTPQECAERFYEIFGSGPRGYSSDHLEQMVIASAALPRADVVSAAGQAMQVGFG